MLRNRNILQLLFCILLLYSVFAEEKFSFSGDKLSTVIAKGKERTLLTGNAVIQSNSTLIHADEIELFGNDFQFASCTKNITVRDEEQGFILKCDNLFFDRKKKVSRIDGTCMMEDYKNEIVVKGGFLENWQEDNITIIQIGVRILKENMTCRSEYAKYNRKTKLLELSGLPVAYWKGDEYKATKIIINLDTDEITLEGDVKGSLSTDPEENKSKK